MNKLLLGTASAMLAFNLAHAQTAATSPSAAPGTGAPPSSSVGAPTTSTPLSGTVNTDNKAAASGDTNQAVVTTGANADQPAKGANSFTRGQARSRIAKKGYTHVTGLKKDSDGVWRGTGTKDGAPVQVWLDYKGNVGQAS